MKRFCTLAYILITLLVAVGLAQSGGGQKSATSASWLQVYDRFDGKWLDAGKWQSIIPQCWGALECVREIHNGQLRLAVRNFGGTDSDSGVQWSESEVYFMDPNAVIGLKADVTLRSFSGIGCVTNSTDLTHTQVMFGGNFFNLGTGNTSDDITAWFIVWVDTTNPQTMATSLWWGNGSGDLSSDTLVAYYPFGTPLTASLNWDKANHRFVASAKIKGDPGPGTWVSVPYSVPDTTPPASAMKNLNAEAHTLNCTSGKTTGLVEATFDNVFISR